MESVAGLDIGSSRVIAVVPGARDPGAPAARALKCGFSCAAGIRKGQVIDVSSLAGSIREALDMAGSEAGVKVDAVYAGFPGHSVEFYIKESGNLIGKGRRVTQQDIERVKRLALVSEFPRGRRVIQAFPFEYILDGAPVGGDPTGMACSRLNMESLIVTADKDMLERLAEAIHRAGARVVDWLPSALAVGEVALESARRQVGVALVEIGESGTSVVLYNHDRPTAFEWLPVGSGHITSDLAICLRTTLEAAEGLKKEVGLAVEPESCDIAVPLPRLSGVGFNEVSRNSAARIIEARMGEILDIVLSSVSRLAGQFTLPGGIVLAGGGSLLPGMGAYASKYLSCEIEVGTPEAGGLNIEKLPVSWADCSGALGLLKYFSKKSHTLPENRQPEDLWSKLRGLFRVSR
ncbi:MAG: cell division protein FtsA [Actinobacteria bacterium]|nr:cell division protein FtsA [Actinomycetota bacterium]